jgi:hypothetical protein
VIENLDRDTVMYILNELNYVLNEYGDRFKGHAWLLVHAISAYARLLRHREYFDDEEVKGMVDKIVGLLNELGRFKSSLGTIAWARALVPALYSEGVRGLMEKALGIDVVDRANEVLGELNELREKVKELMSDEGFMSYVESWFVKADEEAVKKVILSTALNLKHELTIYRFANDELKEAEGLFKEVLGGWVEAYSKADGILRKVLGLGEDLLEWDESSVAIPGSFVNNLASYVIGGLAAIPISAAAVATISALTYMAFEKEGENYLREIIELRGSLERLRRPDGEFNELGELLAYTVAYAMGMSYDEAKKALMDITGSSIDELEKAVEETEERIEKLEKKLELFRRSVQGAS